MSTTEDEGSKKITRQLKQLSKSPYIDSEMLERARNSCSIKDDVGMVYFKGLSKCILEQRKLYRDDENKDISGIINSIQEVSTILDVLQMVYVKTLEHSQTDFDNNEVIIEAKSLNSALEDKLRRLLL